jgi:hypothetical protein
LEEIQERRGNMDSTSSAASAVGVCVTYSELTDAVQELKKVADTLKQGT